MRRRKPGASDLTIVKSLPIVAGWIHNFSWLFAPSPMRRAYWRTAALHISVRLGLAVR